MSRSFLGFVAAVSVLVPLGMLMGQGQPTTPPPPATRPVKQQEFPAKPGETVITFEKYDVGKAVPKVEEKGVKFTLAWAPQRSNAVGRVMFFPHIYTEPERKGILNAMSNEQNIPLEGFLPMGASSVTLVLFGSTSVGARLEAFDKNGKTVDTAALTAAPNRNSPADPVPSFELTVKAPEIVYIRLSGPREGEFLAAEQVRYVPLAKPPELPGGAATAPSPAR